MNPFLNPAATKEDFEDFFANDCEEINREEMTPEQEAASDALNELIDEAWNDLLTQILDHEDFSEIA